MKTRTRLGATLAATLCALFLGAQAASAVPLLNITLAPNPIEGSADGAVDVTYSIENVSGFDVALVDVSASNIDGTTGEFDGLAGDWFFLPPITSGDTVTGLLGQFRFFSTAIVGTTGSALFQIGFVTIPDGPMTYENATLRYRVVDGDTPPVPEPTSLVLLGFALAGAAVARRRSIPRS